MTMMTRINSASTQLTLPVSARLEETSLTVTLAAPDPSVAVSTVSILDIGDLLRRRVLGLERRKLIGLRLVEINGRTRRLEMRIARIDERLRPAIGAEALKLGAVEGE